MNATKITVMPKHTTSTHPLARLRKACGWTREDAARVAGISAASVQNIELGRAPISEDAALRIEAATGCMASSFMRDGGSPLGTNGAPYEERTFQSYLGACSAQEGQVDAVAAEILSRIKTLLSCSGDKFQFVRQRLNHALDQVMVEAGLPPHLVSLVGDLKESIPPAAQGRDVATNRELP